MQSSPLRFTAKRRSGAAAPSTLSSRQSNTPKLGLVDAVNSPVNSLPAGMLGGYIEEWLGDGEYRECTPSTLSLNRTILKNLEWFVVDRKLSSIGVAELRQFFLYVKTGHQTDPRGRWGIGYCKHEPSSTRCIVTDPKLKCVIRGLCRNPVSSRTAKDYFDRVRTFFRWMSKQRYISEVNNPFHILDAPINRTDQLQPYSDDQVDALFAAAAQTQNSLRDETILWLLYDTGIRCTELCTLTRADLDMVSRDKSIRVMGKGRKRRSIYLGKAMTRQMWKYLRHYDRPDNEPLFVHGTGRHKNGAMSKDSLNSLFARLTAAAGVTGVRSSPHTMRHTSAIEFLRAGGTLAELMERLGHTNLSMTKKYVAFAEADIIRQVRYSPADHRARGKNL